MAIVTIPEQVLTPGMPVRVRNMQGTYFFAGHRMNEKTKEEWLEVWNIECERIRTPMGTVNRFVRVLKAVPPIKQEE